MSEVFDREVERIVDWISCETHSTLRRKGVVVGVSGGVDSAVALYLAVRGLGSENVVAVFLPDRDSSPDSERFAVLAAQGAGVRLLTRSVTAALEASGCYAHRDDAIRTAVSDFDATKDRAKIVLPADLLASATLNVFSVVVLRPDGTETRSLLAPKAYLEIVAASNMKQRVRMMMLYFEAERRNYCVMGTANRDEHDLGFFVKYGDGGADLFPIRHLFKIEVYAIAERLGVPREILGRPPTTDTYSAECTQEEFFYRAPLEVVDAVWAAVEAKQDVKDAAAGIGLSPEQFVNIATDLSRKQRTTEPLRQEPLALRRSGTLEGQARTVADQTTHTIRGVRQ